MMMKPTMALVLLAAALCATSCSGEITGSLGANGSAKIRAKSALLPSVSALIGAVAANSGTGGSSILDAVILSKSLKAERGVESAEFRNTTRDGVEGTVSLSQVHDFLTPNQRFNEARFISCEQTTAGGKLSLTLSRANAPEIARSLSPDMTDYLSCLMSPGFTKDWGFITTKDEYLRQLKITYNTLRSNRGLGNALASDLQKAEVRVIVELPGTVTVVRGGTFTGNRAEFKVPALDLLVLEKPLVYEATWKSP